MSVAIALLIDATVLAAISPKAGRSGHTPNQLAIMGAFGAMLPDMLPRFAVTTPLRIAHLLAQVCHESDAFKTTKEYASGEAYEGSADLGNVRPGDGKRFKGRGPIQITGRDNYRKFTRWMRSALPDSPDFEVEPELLENFPWAGWAVFWFWSTRNLNALADRDDIVSVTKVINGGRNGLADRAAYLAKAKTVIARLRAEEMSGGGQYVVLSRGSSGEQVDTLQRALATAGFYRLTIDGDFGPGTEQAVRFFQAANGLMVDGIAGRKTLTLLIPFAGEA